MKKGKSVTVAVAIERRQIVLAKKLADQIEASVKSRGRRNYTYLESAHRWFYGFVGEAAVVNWLRHEGCAFRHTINTSGLSQDSEIYVLQNGARRDVEVKCASQPHHRKMMLPARQRASASYYVAVRLESDPLRMLEPLEPLNGKMVEDEADKVYCAATIMGWASQDDVDNWRIEEVRVRTRVCEFLHLRHPNGMVREIDHGDEIR